MDNLNGYESSNDDKNENINDNLIGYQEELNTLPGVLIPDNNLYQSLRIDNDIREIIYTRSDISLDVKIFISF